MDIKAPFYPIIYVRGFAATMGEIEETVARPYDGFNLGSTKRRQDHKGDIHEFIFESPLLRLIKDHGYRDTYQAGDLVSELEQVPAKSIWIFRYYKQASKDLGDGQRQSVFEIAQALRKFILRVRNNVCGKDAAERAKFRVYLVAHSMGGLVCRCYLQNLCAAGTGVPETDEKLELEALSRNAEGYIDDSVHLVDKVFTYGTPHNGIDFLGINTPDLGPLDPFHVRNFNREVIHDYLRLSPNIPSGGRVDSLNGAFPPARFFSFVGSNYADYQAFFKLSRKATGSMSDGLVMIRNATVAGSPRAFAHRSHSGHYGIVNSEEGYQNLRRFLFGQVRIDARLAVDDITLPKPVQREKDKGKEIRASYHIETTARVRRDTCFLHERRVSQESAIFRDYDRMVKERKPVYLFSGYLMKSAKGSTATDTALAFAVHVGIQVPAYEVDNRFWFDEHYEGGYVFDETITFHVRMRSGKVTIKYGLASRDGLGQANRAIRSQAEDGGILSVEIPLGFQRKTKKPPRPGFRGSLLIEATPWNI